MDLSILPDIDSLLAPIPGDDPAGVPVSYVAREKFETARKTINLSDYAPNDPLRPAEPKFADWPLIVRLAGDTLTEDSKDLMTAARLTEAATKLAGFAGLTYGLTLLRRLIEEAWDRLHPLIEDGDLEVRAAAFIWLDDPARGARFPSAVRAIPLVTDDKGDMTWLGWKAAQTPVPPDEYGNPGPPNPFPERFEKATNAAPRADIQALVDDISTAAAAVEQLAAALDAKLGELAPGMGEIRVAIADVNKLAGNMLAKKGPAPITAAPAVAETTDATAPAATANGVHAPPPVPRTREDAYRQLADAATLLQQLEPHSPIPYMVQRAVALGRLPFPELMKVMIRDPGLVEQMTRELGLDPVS